MAAYLAFDVFTENMAEKVHNLGADALMVMLSNTAPSAANTVKANITEITGGANGYTAGGTAPAITSSAQTGGDYKLVLGDVTWTCTAANTIGPFRYPVLYNDTPTSPADPLIAWWDYGSSITLNPTEQFTWDADPTTGVIQIISP